MTDTTELAPAMKAAAEPISSGYLRNWIVSHDDETCWVGANDDDGNLTPFIEVSIADWSGNKVDNDKLARFIALCRPANILALVEALEKAQRANAAQGDHINQQQDRIESLEKKNAELGKYAGELESHKAGLLKFIRESCYVFDGYDADISDAYIDAASSSLMPKIEAEPCHHCSDGSYSGLPGGACEHCMGTGLDNPAAELESRTVTIKFAPIPVEELGNVRDGKKHPYMFGAGYNAAVIHCESVIQQELDAKGIKWEAE